MERIDRLIIKAKKAIQAKAERLIAGFISYDPDAGRYEARGDLWNGVAGSGVRSIATWHDSKEAAEDALKALAEEYPNPKDDIVIFYDDIEG